MNRRSDRYAIDIDLSLAPPVAPPPAPEDPFAEWLAALANREPYATNAVVSWVPAFMETLVAHYSVDRVRPSFVAPGEAGGLFVPSTMKADFATSRHDISPLWLRRFLLPDAGTLYPDDQKWRDLWIDEHFLADDPEWLTQLLRRDAAGITNTFLLSGNIFDYAFDPAVGYRPALDLLLAALEPRKRHILRVSLARGLRCVWSSPEKPMPEGLGALEKQFESFDLELPLISQVCDLFASLRAWLEENPAEGPVAILFENVHLLIPADGNSHERNFLLDTLLDWSRPVIAPYSSIASGLRGLENPRINHCLILTAESLDEVSKELTSRGGKIDQLLIPRPAKVSARLKFLIALKQRSEPLVCTRIGSYGHSWTLNPGQAGTEVERLRSLAEDTAGLTLIGIEDLIQDASFDGKGLDSSWVLADKRERLRTESEGLLEVMLPNRKPEEFAGYETLRKRLEEVIDLLAQREDPVARSITPMGLLFLGPPGTGKTVAAEVIASHPRARFNMVKLGDIRGQYVGQSEANLSRVLAVLESLEPVIIFMDELDQQEGKRGEGGDSGVSRRIFAKLLQFMSDTRHRGRILWIAASNRPDEIDSAMKRAGRFDLVLPFLLPDQESRTQLFQTMVNGKAGNLGIPVEVTIEDYQQFAESSPGYSGAEIEAIVIEAIRRAYSARSEDGMVLNAGFLREAINNFILTDTRREEYKTMEELARQNVRFKDSLPPETA